MNKSNDGEGFRQIEEKRFLEKERGSNGNNGRRKKYCDEYVPTHRRRTERERERDDSDKEEKTGRGKYDRYRGKGYDIINEHRREYRSHRYRDIRVSDSRMKGYNDRYSRYDDIEGEYGEELVYDSRYPRYEEPGYNDPLYRRYNPGFEEANVNGYRNLPYNNEMIEYNNNAPPPGYNAIYNNNSGYIGNDNGDPYARFDPRNNQRRAEYIEPIEYPVFNEIHDNNHHRYESRHSSSNGNDSSRYNESSRYHNNARYMGDRYDGRYKRENRVYADRYYGSSGGSSSSRYKPQYENEIMNREDYNDRYEIDNFQMKPNIQMY